MIVIDPALSPEENLATNVILCANAEKDVLFFLSNDLDFWCKILKAHPETFRKRWLDEWEEMQAFEKGS